MAKRGNLFSGYSIQARLTSVAYSLLMKRTWVTYTDIMRQYLAEEGRESEIEKYGVSNIKETGELKKAFPQLRKAITETLSKDCIEEQGNNRNKQFRYAGTDDDPLRDMRASQAISSMRDYWRFCQDSAGLLPVVWLEHYLRGSLDLLEVKTASRKSKRIIDGGSNNLLKNIEWLPLLYEATQQQMTQRIKYKPYGEDEQELIFSPHYLKEYNGRWFVLGHAEGMEPQWGRTLSIDRIQEKPRNAPGHSWVAAPVGYYEHFLADRVGVSHWKGEQVQDIHIRAHSLGIFKLTETKPIHPSQQTVVPYGEHEEGAEYGEFVLHVEVNNELIGRILQMGDGLEVTAPASVRTQLKERIERMAQRYQDEP